MSRAYEALIILKPSGTEADLAQAVKQVEEPIKKLGGSIDTSEGWGRRRLAYRISRQVEGHYHLLRFRVDPQQLEELKRVLRLTEVVIRFLILNRENGHPQAVATTSSGAAAQTLVSSTPQ